MDQARSSRVIRSVRKRFASPVSAQKLSPAEAYPVPSKFEPDLNHIGFNWRSDAKAIELEVLSREISLLTKLGFYREYGALDDPDFSGHMASVELVSEIVGALTLAAAIIMDAGHKAPHAIVKTLRAVIRQPDHILLRSVEPEAPGVLGAYHKRPGKERGQYWFDVTDPGLDVFRLNQRS
ncbi:hypothetical protein [Bradyrhizobium symbiodeficiens]|uniref:hypothetical protein n=1 Tax=Bradyrhizobium symbiodeficiens TaxID=1404367 RepID=UPI00140FA267|nr:hypothetical protein [Bradyrhizobium symbiodeficiens]QIO98817.1 hypothetical protein HAU86_02890 [Bradyrhizobium symbiodeficiens]